MGTRPSGAAVTACTRFVRSLWIRWWGVLNTKDYFRLTDRSREAVLTQAVKPAYFVPETVKADVLFRNMKSSRTRFAMVLDEYGGLSGIVTVNDLLEQLVGF